MYPLTNRCCVCTFYYLKFSLTVTHTHINKYLFLVNITTGLWSYGTKMPLYYSWVKLYVLLRFFTFQHEFLRHCCRGFLLFATLNVCCYSLKLSTSIFSTPQHTHAHSQCEEDRRMLLVFEKPFTSLQRLFEYICQHRHDNYIIFRPFS